ncbi:dihydrolipoyl dehydrogenase family protein [Christensenella intestinihominis]|uniref:dihydrolipoyl dehydrogenase family protein n=1 Tax=Christensenella intestinihominis TaxID=1851429 RepID=UPI0008316AF9|nr:NAD(P)/FAD-dependent oxidoreductase [Christensenella intestinihominis]
MEKYDVVIIGAGPGGFTAAYALNKGNKRVAIVEEDLWGGTCPNRGCDPKKIFVSGMEAVERINQLAGKGFIPVNSIRWPELAAFKRTFTDSFSGSFRKKLQNRGIETIEGTAKFLNSKQIQAGKQVIEADAFIIATGQRPGIPDIEGKEFLKTSTDFLDLENLPARITFLGAGYISFELASIANAAGSKVTIIHHNDRPLKGFDGDLVSDMVEAFKEKGIRFVFNTDIRKVSRRGGQLLLTGSEYSETTDYIVCATGRIPNIEKLGLENAGVESGRRGILVNGYLQTSNPAIFACGDVVDKKQPKLTPVATFEGNYAAGKILDASLAGISYPPVVSIVYGSPKLAGVGITVSEAKSAPEKYEIRDIDMTGWFNYRRMNEPVSRARLVYENGQLRGACILNNEADDLVNYLAILIEKGITREEMGHMILGSPTIAADLRHLL